MYYFGKHVKQLDVAEAATLAAIPKSLTISIPLKIRRKVKTSRACN